MPKKTVFEAYRDMPNIHDERRRGPRIKGMRTQLGFCEFMWQLFKLNETERKTDATLKTIVMREYQHEPRTISSFENGNQTIAKLRHEYNSGRLQPKSYPGEHPGKVPQLSCRYNDLGVVMNPRRPSDPATNRELSNNHVRFQDTVHETFEELMARLGRPANTTQYVPPEPKKDAPRNLEGVREESGLDVGDGS
jgi:hypothetical protein